MQVVPLPRKLVLISPGEESLLREFNAQHTVTLAPTLCSNSTVSNLIPRFLLSFLSYFVFYFLNFSVEWTSRGEGLAFRNERGRASSAGLPNLEGNFSCGVQGLGIGRWAGRRGIDWGDGRKTLPASTHSVWASTDV